MPSLPVYVPKPSTSIVRHVLMKSAIVGKAEPERDGNVVVYYEGNAHGASNLGYYYAHVCVAAGRARESYPTTALMRVNENDLDRVGEFDPVRKVFTVVSDPKSLERWASEPIDDIVGIRLPTGEHKVEGNTAILCQITELGSGPQGRLYRTWGGQIITSTGDGTFTVHEYDDPDVVETLSRILAHDAQRLAYAIGTEALPDTSPSEPLP